MLPRRFEVKNKRGEIVTCSGRWIKNKEIEVKVNFPPRIRRKLFAHNFSPTIFCRSSISPSSLRHKKSSTHSISHCSHKYSSLWAKEMTQYLVAKSHEKRKRTFNFYSLSEIFFLPRTRFMNSPLSAAHIPTYRQKKKTTTKENPFLLPSPSSPHTANILDSKSYILNCLECGRGAKRRREAGEREENFYYSHHK